MTDNGDQTCVYSWGATISLSHAKQEKLPRIIEIFDTARVAKVACSTYFSVALTANGRVWWWGNTSSNEMLSPTLVTHLSNVFIKHISCTTPGGEAKGHIAAISDTQSLYMWGNNNICQLGIHSADMREDIPVKVMENVVDVACGDTHTVAIFGDGDVYQWGDGRVEAKVVLSGEKIVKVEAGGYGFCGALTANHTLYTWSNSRGISEGDFCGHGNRHDMGVYTRAPEPVKSLLNQVKYFALGWIHAGAVTLNGDLYTWGEGDTNRLGHGETYARRHKDVPTLVRGMERTHVTKLTLSRGNEGAITESGDVYTWGGKEHGGHHLHATPTKLALGSTFFQEAEVKDLSCGKFNTVIVLHMKTSLRYLCIRTIAQYIDDYFPVLENFPIELKEAVASFLDDRRKLTDDQVAKLGIDYSPVKPEFDLSSLPPIYDSDDSDGDKEYQHVNKIGRGEDEDEEDV